MKCMETSKENLYTEILGFKGLTDVRAYEKWIMVGNTKVVGNTWWVTQKWWFYIQSLQYFIIASGITDPKQKPTLLLHLSAHWYWGGRRGEGRVRDSAPPVNYLEFLVCNHWCRLHSNSTIGCGNWLFCWWGTRNVLFLAVVIHARSCSGNCK